MTLRFDSRLFTLAKDPEQPAAYQDACCIDTEHHIAAIADGVSSALFSGPWAAILAETVVAESPNPCDAEEFAAWLRNSSASVGPPASTPAAWHGSRRQNCRRGPSPRCSTPASAPVEERPGRGLRRLPARGLRPGRQLPLPGPRRRAGALLSAGDFRPVRGRSDRAGQRRSRARPPLGVRNSRRDVLSWR